MSRIKVHGNKIIILMPINLIYVRVDFHRHVLILRGRRGRVQVQDHKFAREPSSHTRGPTWGMLELGVEKGSST